MPYTRSELLAAVRADHPEFQSVDDNRLFAAIAVDHPDLAKGISELQTPTPSTPQTNNIFETPLGALTIGNYAALPDRLLGAAASIINTLQPGGSTSNPKRTLPELTPNQEIGAKMAAVAPIVGPAMETIGGLASTAKSLLPSAERAGANLQRIRQAAQNVAVDSSEATPIIERAKELSKTGGKMPKVLTDYNVRTTPGSVMVGSTPVPIEPPQLNYPESFDFASNAGRLSAEESMGANPQMERLVGQFANAMKSANREAASSIGMGDLYDSAMKEYRQAKTLEDASEVLRKWAIKAAIGTAAGYLGLKGAQKALGQ